MLVLKCLYIDPIKLDLLGRHTEALEAYSRCLALNPGAEHAVSRLGNAPPLSRADMAEVERILFVPPLTHVGENRSSITLKGGGESWDRWGTSDLFP